MKTYDVAIIGAGTAGLSARSEVAKVTDNYVVIDAGPLGTTCARVGCMPSKVLIQIANDFHRRFALDDMGISGAQCAGVDSRKVMQHVRALRDRFVRSVIKSHEDWQEGHLIQKRAQFVDKNTLDLEGEKIHAKKIIIATGSQPVVPGPWKAYQSYLLNTDQFFELEELPSAVAIVGLGVIGIELGQALSRLGVKVVGIDIRRGLGGISDPKVLEDTLEYFQNEFPLHFDGAELVGPTNDGFKIKSGDKEFIVDKVFLTMGRRPNIDGLGLANIGIELNDKGMPQFDDSTFRIHGTPIYFVGDVNAQRPILHEAADEGRVAGYNSVHDKDQCFRRRTNLGIVFTDPNIAAVGKNYQTLKDEKANFVIGEVSYKGQGRAIVKGSEKGLLRIYAHAKSGHVLGAELAAPDGEHLAHLLAWAISLNLTVKEVLSLPFYHPVLEEGIRTALRHAESQLESDGSPLEVLRCQDPPAGTSVLVPKEG